MIRDERWVQHNLIREEGRLRALRELTQSARVKKITALSTELRGGDTDSKKEILCGGTYSLAWSRLDRGDVRTRTVDPLLTITSRRNRWQPAATDFACFLWFRGPVDLPLIATGCNHGAP